MGEVAFPRTHVSVQRSTTFPRSGEANRRDERVRSERRDAETDERAQPAGRVEISSHQASALRFCAGYATSSSSPARTSRA